jgi:hypothetical protein
MPNFGVHAAARPASITRSAANPAAPYSGGTALHLGFGCRLDQSQQEQIAEIRRDEDASFKAANSVT